MATANHNSDFRDGGTSHCWHHWSLSLQPIAVHLRLEERRTGKQKKSYSSVSNPSFTFSLSEPQLYVKKWNTSKLILQLYDALWIKTTVCVCVRVLVGVKTCAVERAGAPVGAVFWRKRRGTSLWSHNWTKWLPFSADWCDSSPLLATIPTRWLQHGTYTQIIMNNQTGWSSPARVDASPGYAADCFPQSVVYAAMDICFVCQYWNVSKPFV